MERLKDTRKMLNELNESYIDLVKATKATAQSARDAKQLWRGGYKSRLIKIGVALVVFPEPTPASEIIGSAFIAAGAVQKAIRNRAMFMEDVKKTLQTTMKDVAAIQQNL
jgi:malate synthase